MGNDVWGVSEENPRGAPRATAVASVFVEWPRSVLHVIRAAGRGLLLNLFWGFLLFSKPCVEAAFATGPQLRPAICVDLLVRYKEMHVSVGDASGYRGDTTKTTLVYAIFCFNSLDKIW